ncbi:MAG TPA: VWA domain-containing protein [Thermoanaerobaculia bacterium]
MRSSKRFDPASVATTLAAGLLLLPFLSTAESRKGQKGDVQEEARVVLVEVPVNVTDRDGRPVPNLTAADFEIFDDGKKQPITGFEILDQRGTVRVPAAGEPPVNPAARRHFLVLFDLSFGSPAGIVAARRAARDFVVNRMKDLDLGAVATYSTETGIRLLVSFTTDRSQLAYAIDTLGLPTLAEHMADPLGLTITPPRNAGPSGFGFRGNAVGANPETGLDADVAEVLENDILRQKSLRAVYRDRVGRMLTSLGQMALALDSVQGRKHILFLSEGFDSRELSGTTSRSAGAQEAEWTIRGQSWRVDSDARFGSSELKLAMKDALALFNRSDCVVHAIDIGGLRAGPETPGTDAGTSGQDSLYYIAEETGGELLKNANNLAPAFEKLLDRTGLIYILAFQPVRVPETGKFHTLKVRARDRSWHVSHRTGYYEAKSYEKLTAIEKKLASSSAIAAAVPRTDIPAWLLAAPFPTGSASQRVPIIVEIPGDRLLVDHTAPKMNVDLFIYAIDKRGATRDYLFQTIGLELSKAQDALRRGGLKYYGEMSLPAGEYTLRALVRNEETGRFGVTVAALNVPDDSKPAPFVLPPLFVQEGEPWILVKSQPREGVPVAEYPFAIAGESFIPAALAGLHSGQVSQVCLIAYNFDADTLALEFSGRVIGVDGSTRGELDLELVKSSNRERQGARKVLFKFRPMGLEPGRYALAVTVRDPRSGKSSNSSFPFDIQ